MLILSNSLTKDADEGSLKLASSLVKRIKKTNPKDTYVVSFEREFPFADEHIGLNKFHLSSHLISLIKGKKQPLLYIPFPAPTNSMALRIWLLSRFAKKGMKVLMIRQYPMGKIAKMLIRMSGAELVVFSKKAKDFYSSIVKKEVKYLKTGVDTKKFIPCAREKSRELKQKYGFDGDKPIILHVGHMKEGRNVAKLMEIDEKYNVLLVVSTISKERQDPALKERLLSKSNIRVMEGFIENIEEIYQMSDVYFFPVKAAGHCIDVPLSCLEAAACNKPIVTTDYGEMEAFKGRSGFCFIDDLTSDTINNAIEKALNDTMCNQRDAVADYDFDFAVEKLN